MISFWVKPYNAISNSSLYEFMEKDRDGSSINNTFRADINLSLIHIYAWLGGAAEQLMGQIASAKIPLSRMITPQLYWVMSDSEFTLDINNPEEPKILCVGNNPDRQNIYGAALGLYNSRIVKLINKKGMLKSSVIIDAVSYTQLVHVAAYRDFTPGDVVHDFENLAVDVTADIDALAPVSYPHLDCPDRSRPSGRKPCPRKAGTGRWRMLFLFSCFFGF